MSLRNLQAALVAERHQVLAELGLDAAHAPHAGKRSRHHDKDPQVVPPEVLRRSSRITTGSAPPTRTSDRSSTIERTMDDVDLGVVASRVPRTYAPTTPAAGSVRGSTARIAYMTAEYLGRHIPIALGGSGNQAKRAVMTEASTTRCPTFSKMSGVQVWKNAIFLFVNVTTGSNVFLDGGRQITWYAQNTMSMESPVVIRLIHHVTGYPQLSLDPCHVILICRVDTDPYIWCGELEYVRHDPRARPIKFWWSLRDADALAAMPQFQNVLSHATKAV
jgi:hypothetical protein